MVFSPWLARVNKRFLVPVNTCIFTALFTIVMSLINIGSTAAFNVFFARQLAFIEGFFAVAHFVSWVAIVAVLWAYTPVKQDAKTVFTDFTGKSYAVLIRSA